VNEERLAEIEAYHQPCTQDRKSSHCDDDDCSSVWPCDAMQLVAEVRRLREENAELHERVAYEHSMYIHAASGR
jgi:hypothetical protein